MAGRPPGLAPLGLNVSNSSLRTSMSTDLGASYNLTDEGIRLLSASAREFKLTSAGLKTTTRGDDASTPADLSYRCSAKDLHVFDVIGSGAGGVVKKAVHVTTHRFVALKVMTVFDKDKRRQLVGEMRTLCDSPRQRGLVSFLGAYYSPETNQINIALEYVDGGSLESLVKRGDRSPSPSRVESPGASPRVSSTSTSDAGWSTATSNRETSSSNARESRRSRTSASSPSWARRARCSTRSRGPCAT